MVVRHKGATLALHPGPGDDLKISYILDYGLRSPIAGRCHTEVITPRNLRRRAGQLPDVHPGGGSRRPAAPGPGGTDDARPTCWSSGPTGPIDNRLRFANEPARHKILDLLGDLSLFGHDLRGHIVAYRSGHPLNVELVRALSPANAEGCQPVLPAGGLSVETGL